MKFVPKRITRNIGLKTLTLKKNSPHIFFVGGVVGVVGSTFLACRATLKLDKELDQIHQDVLEAKTKHVAKKATEGNLDEKKYYSEMTRVYASSAYKVGKLYAPSIALGAVSIASLTGSHIQMTRRNTALTATIAAVTKAYDEYRIRVQEEIGEDREIDINHGVTEEKIEVDGRKKTVKVLGDPNKLSEYSKIFDQFNPNFQKNSEYNRIFIQAQQNWANNLLQVRGWVLLNEVYENLGFEKTSAGSVVGWVIGEGGDDYIDFGLYETNSSRFLDNMENAIVLDFNVDGVIYSLIDKKNRGTW